MTGFSIVVCTHNGASRLPGVLEYLAALRYPAGQLQLVIVDNNSEDATGRVARDTWDALGAPFPQALIREKQPGLANARRAAALLASRDWLLFCDDDNLLDPDYLAVAASVLTEHDDIGVLGGQGLPRFSAEVPNWFYTFADGFAVGVQAAASGDISDRGFVWGAGAIMRRDFLVGCYRGGVAPLLSGRRGARTLSGDDSELCKWYLAAGYRLWYEERLLFHHLIPAQRLRRDYLESLLQGFEAQRNVLKEYDFLITLAALRRRPHQDLLRWLSHEVARFVYPSRIRAAARRNLAALPARGDSSS